MQAMTVYHNPACSKSRRVLAILDERGARYEAIHYLETPPSRATLARLFSLLAIAPTQLVRRDGRFNELGLHDADCESLEQVLELLAAHPELMERPVVVRGDAAIVARPPERVLELLE